MTATAEAVDRQATKVAVVVVGDPDAAARHQAEQVMQAVQKDGGVTMPADKKLQAALLGDAPPDGDEEDGLAMPRSLRRRLGWGERQDIPLLVSLGEHIGAAALLLVRRRAAALELVVFHVAARAFFAGNLPLPAASAAALQQFAKPRITAARQIPKLDARVAAANQVASPTPPAAKPQKPWLRRNWPYLVAGALLAGALAVFVVK